MIRHAAIAATILCAAAGTTASAASIDFSTLEPRLGSEQVVYAQTDAFTENGFTFNPVVGHFDVFRVSQGAMLNIDSYSTDFSNPNAPMTLEITSQNGAFNLDAMNFARIDFQGNLTDTPVFRVEADLVGGGTETGVVTENFTPQNGGDLFFPNRYNGIEALRFVQQGQGIVYLFGMEFSPFSTTPATGAGSGSGSTGGGSTGGGNTGSGSTGGGGTPLPDIAPVPLSASGWLLLASLGAFASVRRKPA